MKKNFLNLFLSTELSVDKHDKKIVIEYIKKRIVINKQQIDECIIQR